MRLPASPHLFGDTPPKRDMLEPHVVERAVDAGARRRFVTLLEIAFEEADSDDHNLRYQPTILMRPRLGRRSKPANSGQLKTGHFR